MKTPYLLFRKHAGWLNWSVTGTVGLLLPGLFLLTGCLARPALPVQTFSFGSPVLAATNFVAGAPVLGIKKVEVVPAYAGRSLVYRTGDFTYDRDPYAAFLAAPELELLPPLRAALCSQGDFSAVTGTSGTLKPDVLVEVEVTDLYGDFRQPGSPKAVLALSFTFCTATNGIATQPLFQKEYSRSLALDAPSAAALMKGWNEGLTEIAGDALTDYRQLRSAISAH